MNTQNPWLALGGSLLLFLTPLATRAGDADADYGARVFGGSSYVQHGPGPAYGGAYSDYAGNASGIEGRFSASYGEFGAVPGYGRFGAGSSWGSGPIRAAGTGRSVPNRRREAAGNNGKKNSSSMKHEYEWKPKEKRPKGNIQHSTTAGQGAPVNIGR